MTSDTPLSTGARVAQRYLIREEAGSGGFSTVYRAREAELDRDIALKVLDFDTDGFDNAELDPDRCAERFRREAKLVARLRHPSTVTLHDFGATADGNFYMALEFVGGTPLSRGPSRPVPPARLVRWLRQALGSLAEAHDYGVLHRDLKPSNLMLTEQPGGDDRIKLIDFGIAKPLRTTHSDTLRPLTAPSRILGTPRYVAPEHVTASDPCPSSDLYSLGLVAHELLLARKPVPGEDPMEMIGYHLSTDYRIAIPSSPAVPERLRRIVNRMTARSIEERYHSAEALRDDLASLPDLSDQPETPRPAPDRGFEKADGGGALPETSDLEGPPAALRESRQGEAAATPPTDPYEAEKTERTNRAAPSARITADDSIHSDGPAISGESTTGERHRDRRISVPPGETLEVGDRPEPQDPTTRQLVSGLDRRVGFLAVLAGALSVAACAAASIVL